VRAVERGPVGVGSGVRRGRMGMELGVLVGREVMRGVEGRGW